MSSVSISNVTVLRDGCALLDEVSLDVNPGVVLGVVGPNGAGKSTLLRVLAGDIVPDTGHAIVEGDPVDEASLVHLSRLRAFVAPQTSSDVVFSVADVIAMGRHPLHGDQDDAAVAAAMERVDISHLAGRAMRTLSSGEQQRVQLARAIAQQTPVILLDEPTSALDVGHQEMVMKVLRKLADDGAAIIAVLHDLNLAAAHADRVLLLDEGRCVAFGSPQEVLTSEQLSDAYREPMQVIDHPFRGCPLVLTIGE